MSFLKNHCGIDLAAFKRCTLRYLMRQIFQNISLENLDFDQMDIQLYKGIGTFTDLKFEVDAINHLIKSHQLPFEVVEGRIGKATINIPWSKILSQNSLVECEQVVIVVRPIKSQASSMDSSFNSMTSSMYLAQECLKREKEEEMIPQEEVKFEAVERLALVIEDVFRQIQLKMKNVVIRIEHTTKNNSTIEGLELRIKTLDYFDEQGIESLAKKNDIPETKESGESSNKNKSSIISRKVTMEGVELFTDEYSINHTQDSDENFQNPETLTPPDSPRSNSSDDKSKHQVNNSNVSDKSDPIHFATLTGLQEFRLICKKENDVPNLEFDLDFKLGTILYHLTPRQLNTIVTLLKEFTTTDDDSLNVNFNGHDTDLDNDTLYHSFPNGLQSGQGWSAATLYDSEDESKQIIAESLISEMVSSFSSSVSSASSSIPSSSSGLLTPTKRQKNNQKEKDGSNQKSGSNHFSINCTSITGVLLHEEVLTPCVEGPLARSSVKELKQKALNFFQNIDFFSLNGYGHKDFNKIKSLVGKASQDNHIRFLVAPLAVDGDWKSSKSSFLNLTAFASRLEIIEGLFDKTTTTSSNTARTSCLTEEYIELLNLSSPRNPENTVYSSLPDIKLEINFSEKTKLRSGRRYQSKNTDITLQLESCFCEVDITLMDRLQDLFNPTRASQSKSTNTNMENPLNCGNQNLTESKFNMNIYSPHLNIKLRIPNVDLRPIHDRTPWWRRMVHKDYFIINMTDATISQSFNSHSSDFSCPLEVTSREVQGYFHHGEAIQTYFILNAKADVSSDGSIINLPRFTMKVFSRQNKSNGFESMTGSMKCSKKFSKTSTEPVNSIYIEHMSRRKQPTPFSKKKIINETDTTHQTDSMGMGEEVVVPGNKEEMKEFIDYSIKNCQLLLEINLPNLATVMPSKYIFELIYNRINNDLLLWEPSAPKMNVEQELDESVYGNEKMFRFSSIPSMNQQSTDNLLFDDNFQWKTNDSNMGSDGESEKFFSFYNDAQSQSNSSKIHKPKKKKNGQNKVVVSLSVGKGIISMYTRSMDSTNNVIPEQQGELRVLLENGSFHSVAGYKGRPGHGYFCLQVQQVALYHNALMSKSDIRNPKSLLEDLLTKGVAASLGNNMEPVIVRSDDGAWVKTHERCDSMNMLTVAVRAVPDKKTNRKNFRVAIALRNATHLYQMRRPEKSWLPQLIDVFDLVDYPIMGYDPPQTQTEFYFHLWDCAVDYRPIYLPYRTVLTLGSLSISSNIIPQTSTSTLRVFAEDSLLFLSNKISSRTTPIDLRRDYVNVIDLPVFEMSFWVSDQGSDLKPKHDLKCALPRINIYTCSDTALALSQLLKYFAEDGDLCPPHGENPSGSSSGPASISSDHDLLVDPSDRVGSTNTVTKSQMVKVHDLMKDAMIEPPKKNTKERHRSSRTRSKREQLEIFRFPDEMMTNLSDKIENQNDSEMMDSIMSSGNEIDSSDDDDSDLERGFTFVSHACVEPPKIEVQNFITEPPRIFENHFSIPLEKIEPLNAPKHFPTPEKRYTLRDITLSWFIFGGSDFDEAPPRVEKIIPKKKERKQEKPKKSTNSRVYLAQESLPSVSYSRKTPNEVQLPTNPPKAKRLNLDWIKKGGPGRDEDKQIQINFKKGRYRYEVYADSSKYSSRHVLLINEYEILDKMESSKWNKFLYQYSSESEPKRSREMFLFKMLVIRPEAENMPKEVCIKMNMLNLRLYIDQDAFLFLFDFFMSFSKNKNSDGNDSGSSSSRHSTPTHQPPILSVNLEEISDPQLKDSVSNNEPLLIQLNEEIQTKTKSRSSSFSETSSQKSFELSSRTTYEAPYFIKIFTFESEVTIKVDYKGKNVYNYEYGTAAGLILGLAHLNNSVFKLKSISYRKGILGFDRLARFVFNEWAVNIKQNCIPSIIQGIGPLHAFFQLFQGIFDLFWMPFEQYLKDGRIVRGLQRGANSFTTSTAMAALDLTVRFLGVIQLTAEMAHGIVSPGPNVRRRMEDGRWRLYNPPSDMREGMTNAYLLVTEGVAEMKDTIYKVATQEHEHKGVPGAVGGVLREIPGTVITPVILLSEGTSNVLGGMRSQLVPDFKREACEKFRNENTHS